MDNKQIFHIAGEVIVVGCISLYFINQIKKLNEEIAGLKDEIKDEKARKKHILENMLYMCELNKKNVLVCNQIFNINNEYKKSK